MKMSKIIFLSILSFTFSYILGLILIPIFKKNNTIQNTSRFLERHIKKNGTPTMGGLIFLIPIFILLLVILNNNFNYQSLLLFFTCFCYFLLGFYDDYLKIKKHNNAGLSIKKKFILELLIATIFFMLYKIYGFSTNVCFFKYCIDFEFLYGILIFLILVGTTNAVNITDGLDGLASGLMIISLSSYSLLAKNSSIHLTIWCLIASLLAFLIFNKYPAKIFMGDLGSLSLGAFLGSIAIITKNELILIIIAFVFVLEILSSFIQVLSIKHYNKKLLLKAPLHHHFEELSFSENKINLIFYITSIIFNILALIIKSKI